MAGRHSTHSQGSRRGWLFWVGLVGVAAMIVGAVIVRNDNTPAAASCESTSEVVVAAAPEIQPVVQQVADSISSDSCAGYDVQAAPPAVFANALSLDEGGADLWIPDSTTWIARATPQGEQGPTVLAKSLALSPVVLATAADDDSTQPVTWLEAMSRDGYRAGDALTSTTAGVPLLGAKLEEKSGAESSDAVSAAFVTLAQQQRDQKSTSQAELLGRVAKKGGSAVVTEQTYVTVADADPDGFQAETPKSGTLMLDYPLAAVDDSDATKQAAEALAEAMTTKDAGTALSEAGLRTPDGRPLAGDRGVGAVKAMKIDDPAIVAATLKNWAVVAMPGRALAVVDVSGSMEAQAGDSTRIGLMVSSSLKSISLMPDTWAMGSWAFSTELGGPNQDWKVMEPIRKFSEKVGGKTQRTLVNDATKEMPSLVGGGTGLYDTTLAAFRTVQSGYDPRAINSVILVSDGQNEDSDSISESELIDTLKREQDPARPVVIVTLGISEDADAKALGRIAKATGGTSYIARSPEDMSKVFVTALEARN